MAVEGTISFERFFAGNCELYGLDKPAFQEMFAQAEREDAVMVAATLDGVAKGFFILSKEKVSEPNVRLNDSLGLRAIYVMQGPEEEKRVYREMLMRRIEGEAALFEGRSIHALLSGEQFRGSQFFVEQGYHVCGRYDSGDINDPTEFLLKKDLPDPRSEEGRRSYGYRSRRMSAEKA